jgi:hypothetical protein
MTKAKPLTFHNGQYRSSIGYERKGDGSRKPKVFMLGKDDRVARLKEQNYRTYWDSLVFAAKSRGFKKTTVVWTDAALKQAETETRVDLQFVHEAQMTLDGFNALSQAGTELYTTEVEEKAYGVSVEATPLPLSLYAAIKMYTDHLEKRVAANDLSDSNYKRQLGSMKYLKQAVKKDLPLTEIDHDRLVAIRLYFQARPKTNRGQGMKWATIQTTLGHIRSLLSFLATSKRWTSFDCLG